VSRAAHVPGSAGCLAPRRRLKGCLTQPGPVGRRRWREPTRITARAATVKFELRRQSSSGHSESSVSESERRPGHDGSAMISKSVSTIQVVGGSDNRPKRPH
jgi:hypothetical protein